MNLFIRQYLVYCCSVLTKEKLPKCVLSAGGLTQWLKDKNRIFKHPEK
jgi:hypothetical protein